MGQVLLGSALTERILAEAKATAEELKTQGIKPALILLYAQGVSSAERYCAALKRAAKFVPVEIEAFPLDPELPEEAVRELVVEVALDPHVHGLLFLDPFPWPLVCLLIPPEKDVDGVHPQNLGRLLWRGGEFGNLLGPKARTWAKPSHHPAGRNGAPSFLRV